MKQGITIGICIYKEEHLIDKLLESISRQNLENILLKKIVCVADCPDKITLEKIRQFNKLPIKTIINKKRLGKYNAINKIISESKTRYIVLVSADVYLGKNSLERIISPMLKDRKVGIVASRINKEKKRDLVSYMAWLEWNTLNNISRLSPKYGEFIAFRNAIDSINMTSVDEEEIAAEIQKKGFIGRYNPSATCYNKSPGTIADFIRQRRRIFTGHLFLKKRQKYTAPTLNNGIVLKNTLKLLKISDIHLFLAAGFIESYSRILGYIDYLMNREQIKWGISESTKK